jgi:hypothetical protein
VVHHLARTERDDHPAYPPGEYIVHGRSWYTIQPDGTRRIWDRHADVENLCRTLA